MESQKTVLAKLLPLDTEITDEGYITTTIGDLIDTIDRPHDIGTYYLTNTVQMKKPGVSFFSESIGENMDENHQDRYDKYEETLEPLQSAIQAVFEKWREGLTHEKTVFAMDTIVDFTGMPGYLGENK